MTTPYIDPNLIFAENAPTQDKPAAFENYDKGWDESRKNDGRPSIKQMNYLQQQADLKNLYIHENGAALPYKEGVAYEDGAVVVKDGVLQQWKGGVWVNISAEEVKKYLIAAGVDESELNDDYEYLMQRLAQIAVDKGWAASFVVSASGDNQQEINDLGGSYWREKPLGYDINSRVMLENGDIVRSTVANNTVDPNVNMDGWIEVNSADYIKYSYLKEYADATIGQKLQAATEKTVYLLDYIPKSQRAAILNGTSVYDASANIISAVNEAIARDATLVLPQCKLTYSSFPNIKTPNFKIIGAGSNKTTLNYTGTGNAFSANAFESGSPSDPFIDGLFISGFAIIGDTFTNGFFGQGFARSFINDIRVNGSTGVDGTAAFRLAGCMLSTFNNLVTSYVYGSLPYRGLQLTAGTRAGVSVNGCSNNLFLSCYAEGNKIGWQITANGGDQNTFINGSPEACTVYGLVVGVNCRYNTFVGVGFENKDAVNGDVNDSGIYSSYLACYSAKQFLVSSASRGLKIDGGFFERLEIVANARATVIDRVTVNHWNTGSGGLFNNGVDADIKRVTDSQTGQFISAYKPRTGLTVSTSPFTYTNKNQLPVKIRVQGGTVTQTLIRRGTDTWIESNPVAAGGGVGTVGVYIVMPQEILEVSFSAAPTINLIPL